MNKYIVILALVLSCFSYQASACPRKNPFCSPPPLHTKQAFKPPPTKISNPQPLPTLVQSSPITSNFNTHRGMANAGGRIQSNINALQRGLTTNSGLKIKNDVGAKVNILEQNAGAQKAFKNKKLDNKYFEKKVRETKTFQKQKKETLINYQKRVANQVKLEEAAYLAKQRGFKKLSAEKKRLLKKKLREELSYSKNQPLSKIGVPKNYLPKRQLHVLNRHASISRTNDKSKFPASWSNERILHNISDVATDPNSLRIESRGLIQAIGIRDGEICNASYKASAEGLIEIRTGYPIQDYDILDKLIDDNLISM